MRSKNFLYALVSTLALSVLGGCDYTEIRNYLDARLTVVGSDAKTPVTGLKIASYDWTINFNDGSTILETFQDPRFVTDAAGKVNFVSDNLYLQSGNSVASCTTVCVDYDSYWDEWCVEEDEDGYCIDWDGEWVDYCAEYAEDCDYYYPARDVSAITSAYTDISYRINGSAVTTPSLSDNVYATSYNSTTTKRDQHNTLVEKNWVQEDTFVTPLVGGSVGTSQQPLTSTPTRHSSSPNLKKSWRPARGFKHKPIARPASRKVKAAELDSFAKRIKLESVRQSWKATLKTR